MNEKVYAKDCIREVMSAPVQRGKKLAVHEIQALIKKMKNVYHSENSIATRLSEMARYGEIRGTLRKGTSFKEWEYLGYHTAMDPAKSGAEKTEGFYFFFLQPGQESPFYTSWTRAMSAAAKHLNDERKSIAVYTGTPKAPQQVVTLSK